MKQLSKWLCVLLLLALTSTALGDLPIKSVVNPYTGQLQLYPITTGVFNNLSWFNNSLSNLSRNDTTHDVKFDNVNTSLDTKVGTATTEAMNVSSHNNNTASQNNDTTHDQKFNNVNTSLNTKADGIFVNATFPLLSDVLTWLGLKADYRFVNDTFALQDANNTYRQAVDDWQNISHLNSSDLNATVDFWIGNASNLTNTLPNTSIPLSAANISKRNIFTESNNTLLDVNVTRITIPANERFVIGNIMYLSSFQFLTNFFAVFGLNAYWDTTWRIPDSSRKSAAFEFINETFGFYQTQTAGATNWLERFGVNKGGDFYIGTGSTQNKNLTVWGNISTPDNITAKYFKGNGSNIEGLNGSNVTFSGTPDGTKFLRDDNSWQPPPGGGVSFKEFNHTSVNITTTSLTTWIPALTLNLTAGKHINIECDIQVNSSTATVGVWMFSNVTGATSQNQWAQYLTALASLPTYVQSNTANTTWQPTIGIVLDSPTKIKVHTVQNIAGNYTLSYRAEAAGQVGIRAGSWCRSIET